MKKLKLTIVLSFIVLVFFGFKNYSVKTEIMDNKIVRIAMAQIICIDGDRSQNSVTPFN